MLRPLRWAALTLALPLAPARPAAAQPAALPYDVVVTGGRLLDGTGAPARPGDLGIRDGRLVRLAPAGTLADSGRDVVRATGRIVAPGFIDLHAHTGTEILRQPDAENFVRQGITTSVASLHSQELPWPLAPHVEALRAAIDIAYFAGHTWIRRRVMGLDARAPTPVELAHMVALVDSAMQQGAFGLATGLEYVPATYAETPELVAMARAARGGVYMTHMRDEGPRLLEGIREVLQIVREAGLPGHINHLKVTGAAQFGGSRAALALLDSAVRGGLDVSWDVYPYTAFSTYGDLLFPPWALADGPSAYAARIADPAVRARLAREMRAIFPVQAGRGPSSIRIREAPGRPSMAGRTLADLLRADGRAPTIANAVDAVIDLQARGGFIGIFEAMDPEDVQRFLVHPRTAVETDGDLVTLGVGYPHPRSYGALPRVLGTWVRDRRVLSLETAVAKMTRLPAERLRLADRGRLAPGLRADVVVFDPATIGDAATYTDPHHYAIGVTDVLVAGVPVLRDSRMTGARPGRGLRRP